MPLQRILSIPRLPFTARGAKCITRFRPPHFVRWQQTGVSSGGSISALRVLLYGVTGTAVCTAATVAYANYDPVFKNRVSEYVPAFGRFSDAMADKWVSLTGSSVQKGDSNVGLQPKKQEIGETKSVQHPTKPVLKDEVIQTPEPAKVHSKKDKPVPSSATSLNKTSENPPIAEIPEVSPTLSPGLPNEEVVKPKEESHPAIDSDQSAQSKTEIVPPEEVPPTPLDVVTATGSTEAQEPVVDLEKEVPKQVVYPVENAVASVKEETEKVAAKIMSEQVEDHQESQTIGEQWLKETSKIDAKLHEVFEEFKVLTSKVWEAQKAVVDAIKDHQQNISEAIKSSGDEDGSVEAMAESVANSEEKVGSTKKDLQDVQQEHDETTNILNSLLLTAEKVGLKSKAEEFFGEMAALIADLQVGKSNIEEVESSSEVLEEYHQETKKTREELQRELGAVPPKAELKEDTLIHLQQKKIKVLKKRLEDSEQKKAQQLATALEKQKSKLEQLAEEKIKLNLQKQQLQLEKEFARKESEITYQYDSELREKLRLQSDAHTSHLTEALRVQADELVSKWSTELELKLMEQESQYQTELTKAMSRLRGIESMVNTVANAGEITRHQQSIRNACDTLSGALEQANTNPDPSDRYTFTKELVSLREVARDDKFLLSVLDSIPEQAVSPSARGIQSEAGLKERFKNVYRICKRVALVPETGGGLGTYALSYLQSLLVFNVWSGVKVQSEQNLSQLDTFELLNLANGSIKMGDIESAVWYVNHLKNESRRVAQDWLEDARLYLETKQAVSLIQTYMAANNISFVE